VKQEDGSVLRMKNALQEVGYPPPILVVLEDGVVIFVHITGDHCMNN